MEIQQLVDKNVIANKGKIIVENQELATNLPNKDNNDHYFLILTFGTHQKISRFYMLLKRNMVINWA